MGQLISSLFHEAFGNEWLDRCNDQSAFDVSTGRMVMTTDGYVVSPLFFPGAISALLRCTAPSMTSRWPARVRSICRQVSSSRRGSASLT